VEKEYKRQTAEMEKAAKAAFEDYITLLLLRSVTKLLLLVDNRRV
jgi:hypothetical protein